MIFFEDFGNSMVTIKRNEIVLHTNVKKNILLVDFEASENAHEKVNVFCVDARKIFEKKGFITLLDIYCLVGGYLTSIKNPFNKGSKDLGLWEIFEYNSDISTILCQIIIPIENLKNS